MRKRNTRVAAALLATAAALVAVIVVTGAFASADPGADSAQIPSLLSQPSTAQVVAFPVLGQQPTASPNIATSPQVVEVLNEAESKHGVNPSLGRTVLKTSELSAVVVPGQEFLCLVEVYSGAGAVSECGAEPEAEKEGLATDSWETDGTHGDQFTVTGVLPSPEGISNLRAVSETGAETPVQISPGGGYTVVTSIKPSMLRWTSADGTQHSRTLFWPSQV